VANSSLEVLLNSLHQLQIKGWWWYHHHQIYVAGEGHSVILYSTMTTQDHPSPQISRGTVKSYRTRSSHLFLERPGQHSNFYLEDGQEMRRCGAAAELAASHKEEKYANIGSQYLFAPIAFET